MYIYCVLFILLAVIAIEYEFKTINRPHFILALIATFLILFVGFRDVSVSRDYLPYLNTFNYILHSEGSSVITFLPLYEPGFAFLVKVGYFLFSPNGAIALMVLFAALSIPIKFFAFQKLAFNPFLVLLLYYSHYFLIQEMTQIRNGLACAFFLLSLFYYLKNQRIKVFVCIIFALMFHNSALFYFLIFFINKDRLNPVLYGAFFIGAIALGLIRLPLLSFIGPDAGIGQISTKLTTYIQNADSIFIERVRFFNVLNICNVFVTGYIFFYCIRKKITEKRLILFLKCNIISIFMYGLLIDVPTIASRVTELFGAVFPLLFAYPLKLPPFGKWNIVFVIALAAIYFYINIFYGDLLNPYKIIRIR